MEYQSIRIYGESGTVSKYTPIPVCTIPKKNDTLAGCRYDNFDLNPYFHSGDIFEDTI